MRVTNTRELCLSSHIFIFIMTALVLTSGFFYSASAQTNRPLASWPPPLGQLRVIIDTDAANEIDDQYALALALGRPDRFNILGFVAAHFGDAGGYKGIEKSVAEIELMLAKMDMTGKYPIKRGSHPIRYKDHLEGSEGVDFIIEQAMASTPEDPLWLIMLGPATDAAVALEQEPKIADRLIVFWHGRTQKWPERCLNFNVFNDLKAVQLLFDSRCRFILFDTGGQMHLGKMEETEKRFAPLGPLGRYLHELRFRDPRWQCPTKGVYDLADIAAMIDPDMTKWEKVRAPSVNNDFSYNFQCDNGKIVRICYVDVECSFDLLEESLRRLAAERLR